MIDFNLYCQIHRLHRQEGLRAAQIARQLDLDVKTVSRWLARNQYQPIKARSRTSKLDPYKGQVIHWLHSHPYSASQILIKLRHRGYSGGYTILKTFIAQVRPKSRRAFQTLHFEPGQCAQVDWGSYGSIGVENTRRNLSFFVIVLCHSRRLYVEFTLAQRLEHFLACHQNAWEYFGAVSREVMVDNCKVAVLHHPPSGPVLFQPRYQEFAQHYGFGIRACTPRQPQQKGRVENAVAYVKNNFLPGREITGLSSLNAQCREWLDTVANQRIHGTTNQKPDELFKQEKAHLAGLPVHRYDIGILQDVRANNRFRVQLETNLYSVPAHLASQRLTMKVYPDKIRFYHQENLVAEHTRSYGRKQERKNPDHEAPLLARQYKDRDQRLVVRFLSLSSKAEVYLDQLKARRMHAVTHVRKMMAMVEAYGADAVIRALEDATESGAFSSEYVLNLIQQRARPLPEPGALHLTRREDLLELDMPEADLSVYDQSEDLDSQAQ